MKSGRFQTMPDTKFNDKHFADDLRRSIADRQSGGE
jgi:hypothetical protein